MHFTELALILSICYNIASCFIGHSGLNLLKEPDQTLFDLNSDIQVNWITQPIDHFDSHENTTFNVKYYQSMQFWKPNGPIYISIDQGGGERLYFYTGMPFELANETNGALILMQYRYYGESIPFQTYTTENLKFVSVDQVLADTAKLLNELKQRPEFKQSKVVIIGETYMGSLAAWMRLSYPDLVDAAIASSAPVLAKTDFYEYVDSASSLYAEFGTPGCTDNIRHIFKRYEDLFKTDDGIKKLKAEEQICEHSDMKNVDNQYEFLLAKQANFMEEYFDIIKAVQLRCKQIERNSHVVTSKSFAPKLWDADQQCYDYDNEKVIESIKLYPSYMASVYQICTEYGYFRTTSSNNYLFTEIPIEYFIKTCTETFGPDYDKKRVDDGVGKTNVKYGGLTPNVTNVVFVNGGLDPWHRLGVLEDLSYDAPAVRIPRGSRCQDQYSETPSDSEELKQARRYIKYLVKKWIGVAELVKH